MNKKVGVKVIKGADSKSTLLKKAMFLQSVDEDNDPEFGILGVINPPYPITELQSIVEKSTILRQCVEAYRRNIVGFGAGPEYLEDDTVEGESPEMESQWEYIEDFLRHFNFDQSFEDVFGDIIEDREITGNGYMEVIRDGAGLAVEGTRLNPANIKVMKVGEPVDVTVTVGSEQITRRRRFRRYVQEVGTTRVYYKEFGDPRTMDHRSGKYEEGLPDEYQANEILHFKIGRDAYGVPRWIGQLIHMMGARMAEELNYRYFTQGRHTPMAILLHNAQLSEESEQQLAEYAASVEGVDNSHRFLVIEAEGLEEGILEDQIKNAKVEMQSLASMLQNDALFLDYDESSRRKVQSAFRLPDIYVGRSTDFNRATADTARYITEEQVFEPERNSLEWVINNKLLSEHPIDEVRVNFKRPEITNADEVVNVINAGNTAGALAPNDVRPILADLLGIKLEPFEEEEYDRPVKAAPSSTVVEDPEADRGTNTPGETENIQRAVSKGYEQPELVNLLKDLRDVLEEMNDGEGK